MPALSIGLQNLPTFCTLVFNWILFQFSNKFIRKCFGGDVLSNFKILVLFYTTTSFLNSVSNLIYFDKYPKKPKASENVTEMLDNISYQPYIFLLEILHLFLTILNIKEILFFW